MLCSCIVNKLKSFFDPLVCEFTAKACEGGIVSRCRCNIFTIGNRSADIYFLPCSSRIRKFLAPSHKSYAKAVSRRAVFEWNIHFHSIQQYDKEGSSSFATPVLLDTS